MKTNEEKLTAYALNELPDDERLAVEAELETNPEARKAVDEIRELAAQLTGHYAAEEEPCLTDEQREAIFKAARKKREKILAYPRHRWIPYTITSAAAALFLFVSGGLVVFHTVYKKQMSFSPPAPISRPKMALRKPKIKARKTTKPAPSRRIVAKSTQSMADIQLPEASSMGQGLSEGVGGFEMMPAAGEVTLFGGSKSVSVAGAHYASTARAPGLAGRQLERFEKEERTSSQWGPSIEDYAEVKENVFKRVVNEPLSTFSIDVDTASYANVRRFLKGGHRPPKDSVRIEEMINYFDYSYEPPTGDVPFSANFAQAQCPWNQTNKLVRIALKGREIAQDSRPALNLVFLLDVSGSMNNANKLPLVKRSMEMLTNQLDERDRVSIVVYAGASGLVLPPTSGADRNTILGALDRLEAGGGTNGGQGIQLAYKTAQEHFHKDGVNRVILCTDGDFNIGVTQGGDLNRLIEEKAKSGIFLSVLGFGMGNYKDGTLEGLADRGNGNYAYIDTFSEARKVLVDEMSGTLVTIAKDVKIQVEFNPARVAGYRLIGYENRMLAAEDFNDDTKDAGEIGAGHTVTALYEIVPAGQPVNGAPPVDELKYQAADSRVAQSKDLLTVKLRYKQPDGDTSRKLSFPLDDETKSFEQSDPDFRFATSVAGFGMLLRDSENKGDLTIEQVIEWAQGSLGKDEFGYRREFVDLVRNAAAINR